MKLGKPLQIWLESSIGSVTYEIISFAPKYFKLVKSPDQAEVILFENDKPSYIKQTHEFKTWPQKCIVINERDDPSYFLPACYASNERGLLSYKRVETIPYFISQRTRPNPFIRNINNNSEARYLYSFLGGSTSWVRKKLFRNPPKHEDVLIQETNQYHHWSDELAYVDQKMSLQKYYSEVLEKSSFFLCPRGAGTSSIRLFEVMRAGRVPVIIADRWIPVKGIPWKDFSIFVPENKISKIDSIIRSYEHVAKELGEKAQCAWKNFCAPGADAALLAQSLREICYNRNEKRERFIRFIFPFIEIVRDFRIKFKRILKYLVLNIFALIGRKFPFSLNRSMEEQLHSFNNR